MSTKIYQGWRYTEDRCRPVKERVIGTRGDQTIKARTEPGLRKMIDQLQEEESQAKAKSLRQGMIGAFA